MSQHLSQQFLPFIPACQGRDWVCGGPAQHIPQGWLVRDLLVLPKCSYCIIAVVVSAALDEHENFHRVQWGSLPRGHLWAGALLGPFSEAAGEQQFWYRGWWGCVQPNLLLGKQSTEGQSDWPKVTQEGSGTIRQSPGLWDPSCSF